MKLLPQSFYARDALDVARDLLGMLLRRGKVVLRITEVEAYRWPDDSANHCRAGRTPRNEPMWGPPGHAYVYLCYGMHHMLNLVTNRKGEGAAVLIRACEPVAGLAVIRARREVARSRDSSPHPGMLTGPGKIGAALALDTAWNGHALFRRGGLEVLKGDRPKAVLAGPRIGIAYAKVADVAAPWRLAIADSPWVSHRGALVRP